MASPSLNFLGAPVSLYCGDDNGSGAIVERWGPDGPSADVQFLCQWADRYAVVKYLRGGVVQSGKTFSYWRPASYPDSPNLLCTAIGDIRGIKFSTYQTASGTIPAGWGRYKECVVPAHFSVPSWDAIGTTVTDPSGQPMTSTKFRGSAEIFTPPGGAYYYAAGAYTGKPVAESSVGLIRSRTEISMTRHMVPSAYVKDFAEWVGTVNNEAVTFGDYTFPRGCVLFATWDTDPVADPTTGQKCWDYTFSLMGNFNIEWNEFMDPAGQYVLINDQSGGGGDAPFEYVDFGFLFGNSFG